MNHAPRRTYWWTISLALSGSLAACGGEGQGEDPPWMITATEGSTHTGDEGDGADETGGGPAVADSCLMDPVPDRFGYKYQCAGSITIDISIEGDFDGSPVLESLTLDFGVGVEGDS
jgi:predicted small lipoprotein YifL